jgi:hypothetical protein
MSYVAQEEIDDNNSDSTHGALLLIQSEIEVNRNRKETEKAKLPHKPTFQAGSHV